jgi:hypothetical protein
MVDINYSTLHAVYLNQEFATLFVRWPSKPSLCCHIKFRPSVFCSHWFHELTTIFFCIFYKQNASIQVKLLYLFTTVNMLYHSVRGATGSDEPWPAEQPSLAVFPDWLFLLFSIMIALPAWSPLGANIILRLLIKNGDPLAGISRFTFGSQPISWKPVIYTTGERDV